MPDEDGLVLAALQRLARATTTMLQAVRRYEKWAAVEMTALEYDAQVADWQRVKEEQAAAVAAHISATAALSAALVDAGVL